MPGIGWGRLGGRHITEDPWAQLIAGETDVTIVELIETMHRAARSLMGTRREAKSPRQTIGSSHR